MLGREKMLTVGDEDVDDGAESEYGIDGRGMMLTVGMISTENRGGSRSNSFQPRGLSQKHVSQTLASL